MIFVKWAGIALLFVVVALALVITIVPRFLDRIYYRGPVSAHFDGERFFNPDGAEDTGPPVPTGGSRGGFFWRYLTGSDGRPPWPKSVAVTPGKPAAMVAGDAMVATWIGHATLLVQTQGLNILTDPVWGETAGPFGLGPRRVTEPGVRFDDLPRVDVVLLSHNHYDHMDLKTLKRLYDRDKPLIVTPLGNDAILRGTGVESRALDWGGSIAVKPGVTVHVTRNHHWGSRWFTDRNRALWSSFVVQLPGGNFFFAGDTGMGDASGSGGGWIDEARVLGPIRLAAIPIGAFRFMPGQMGIGSHVGPVDAVEIYRKLEASHAIAIHWGTFRLSYEARETPSKLLDLAVRCTRQSGFAGVPLGVPQPIAPYAMPPALPLLARAELLRCLDTPEGRALE